MTTASSRTRRGGQGDAGETLFEILVTLTIMGIALVAIITGIATAIRFSDSDRDSASAQVALSIGAEAVKAVTPSVACSALTTSSYGTAISSPTPAVAYPAYPATWSASNLSITAASCDNASTLKLQTITIKATVACPSSCASESVTVIKRSP